MSDKLQKLLAHAGLGSRRELETWITAGRITVNGKRAKLGDRASVSDRILVDGKLLYLKSTRSEQIKALIYHKPEGEICTRNDPKGRPTVFENLPAISGGRWVSVGRLDINSSGLLLFTNNGDLANRLMHPSTGLEREYLVRIRGRATEETIKRLTTTGVIIDGKPAHFQSVTAADLAEEGSNHWYRVVICEGRYREVRRMWDAVNHTVSRLKRIRYGTVKLTRDIKQGQHSKMAPKQLEKLVFSVGLGEEFQQQLYSIGQNTGKNSARKSKFVKKTQSTERISDIDARGKSKTKRKSNDITEPKNERNVRSRTSKKNGETSVSKRKTNTRRPSTQAKRNTRTKG